MRATCALIAVSLLACSGPEPATEQTLEESDASVREERDVRVPSADAIVFADSGEDATAEDAPAANPCQGRPDGFEWGATDLSRCCSGRAIVTNTNDHCGVCGIKCNAANGESCQALAGRYFCRGCVESAKCWSRCCSTSFTPFSCAASDCNGNCVDTLCPPGARCVPGAPNSSNYCAY